MIIIDQSAVIPYRKDIDGSVEIMLVTTREGNWTIPKGTIEDNLSPRASGAKEALEEAGISGKVKKKKVGTYSYKKLGEYYCVKVYKMKVKMVYSKWDEEHFRERLWIPIKNVSKFIKHENLLTIINNAFIKNPKQSG